MYIQATTMQALKIIWVYEKMSYKFWNKCKSKLILCSIRFSVFLIRILFPEETSEGKQFVAGKNG